MATIYVSDISGDFSLDSKGFLKINENEQAINDQIKFILTTFKGEVLFKPSQGNSLEEELWEFSEDQLELNSTLTEILEQNIPYITPIVTIEINPENAQEVWYTVKYTIKNDPNIGQIYTSQGTI